MPAPVFSSPKTSLAAIFMIVSLIGYIGYEFVAGTPANIEWGVVITALLGAIGFFFARDNDKSSEDVGVK